MRGLKIVLLVACLFLSTRISNAQPCIVLSSPVGTTAQSVCINTPITDIVYSVIGGATGAGVTGLPAGITGTYNAGVFTISGTPTESGTFNYSVTTTGPCIETLNGTVIVNPDASISLVSAVGTNAQGLCINTPLTEIRYSIGGGGTGAGVTGLPVGLTGTYGAGIFSINGIPTESGTFNYIVTTTGSCLQTSANGTVTVYAIPTANAGSAGSTCVTTAYTVSGVSREHLCNNSLYSQRRHSNK